jgi:hypothetical protein
MPNITDHDIRTLAYKLWQMRGCPFNNRPDEDWMESERILRIETTTLEGASVEAAGTTFDPSSINFMDSIKIGPRNDYQYKISFGGEDNKLRWIDDFRVLGSLDPDILRDFQKCYPKSYGNFLVLFKTGSVAENRGEIEANCFYLNADTSEDAACNANESLRDALNGAINPFAPMHRSGPDFPPYMSGATNPTEANILIPYKIVNNSGESIWCKCLSYNSTTGMWRYDNGLILRGNTISDGTVFALFERK